MFYLPEPVLDAVYVMPLTGLPLHSDCGLLFLKADKTRQNRTFCAHLVARPFGENAPAA
jgi:hypothetical protein